MHSQEEKSAMKYSDCPFCDHDEYTHIHSHCSENGWIMVAVCNSCEKEYEFYFTDEHGESLD